MEVCCRAGSDGIPRAHCPSTCHSQFLHTSNLVNLPPSAFGKANVSPSRTQHFEGLHYVFASERTRTQVGMRALTDPRLRPTCHRPSSGA